MRFDTQNAGHSLVGHLLKSGVVSDVTEDGSDIVLLRLVSGQQLMVYLIDSSITSTEIRETLLENTKENIYTLYFFWCDLMLPQEKAYYVIDDWMKLLIQLHGNKLYGFNVMGRNAHFFPVYFQGQGSRRYINFGEDIDYRSLGCVDIQIGRLVWRMGGFSASERDKASKRVFHLSSLAPYFDVLGLPHTAELSAVKTAYRRLARLFHPDLNPRHDSNEQMKKINDAYDQLSRFLKDE